MTSTSAAPAVFSDDVLRGIEDRLRALPRRALPDEGPRAAVLVPLCHVQGRAAVLFTKRSEHVGTHKGQVSFPGGRMDEGDADLVATALRELEEEVGIRPSSVRILGTFHDALSITGVRVTPVVGFVGELGDLSRLVVHAHEIDLAFTIPCVDLVGAGKRDGMQLGPRGRFPVFNAGPAQVWGLTAVILDELLKEAFGLDLPPP